MAKIMANSAGAYATLLQEVNQHHRLRKPLYQRVETALAGFKIVALFTSFTHPVILNDGDADMLEEVLSNTSFNGKRLALVLNSPGGEGLAAERIVNLCRTYSNNDFIVVVPKAAKSAATIVCLGAREVVMSATSELGPIDPQILISDEQGRSVRYQAAHEILESYAELMRSANKTKGRIEPFLQQLARYDARDVQGIKSAQSLSEAIAINLLKTGIFSKLSRSQIKAKIRPLTDPHLTIDHGRPLFPSALAKCGLNIRVIANSDPLWRSIRELYIRLSHLTDGDYPKVIESEDESYYAPMPS